MGTGAVTGTPDRAVGQAFRAATSCAPAAALPPAPVRRVAEVSVIPLTGHLAGLAVRSLALELAEVALAAFEAPPWNETPAHARQLVDRMLTDTQRPGVAFALVVMFLPSVEYRVASRSPVRTRTTSRSAFGPEPAGQGRLVA